MEIFVLIPFFYDTAVGEGFAGRQLPAEVSETGMTKGTSGQSRSVGQGGEVD